VETVPCVARCGGGGGPAAGGHGEDGIWKKGMLLTDDQ